MSGVYERILLLLLAYTATATASSIMRYARLTRGPLLSQTLHAGGGGGVRGMSRPYFHCNTTQRLTWREGNQRPL